MAIKLPAPYIIHPDGTPDGVGIQQDLEALAAAARTPNESRIVNIAGSSVSLGAIDGENITGVRLSFAGRFMFSSTGVAVTFALKPNGLATIPSQLIENRVYWNSPGTGQDYGFTGGIAGADIGIPVARGDWLSSAGQENGIWFDGVLFTKSSGPSMYRRWMGKYGNNNYTTDGAQWLMGDISSKWVDAATPLTSLSLVFGPATGTLTGRISVEIIP